MILKLTSETVLIVLLDVKDNGSCDMYFRKEIEVSEDEECLALILVVQPHVLLKHEQVVFHDYSAIG